MKYEEKYKTIKYFNEEAKNRFKSSKTPIISKDEDKVFEKRLRIRGRV